MAWFEALLLGMLQGLTEFLPVSSSGHMVLARSLMPELNTPGILFEVLSHAGTLLAVLLVFRREIKTMALSLFPGGSRDARKLAFYIIAATIPTGIAGLLLKHRIELLFDSVTAVAVGLLFTGLILWLSDVFSRPVTNLYGMGVTRAVVVGLAQSVALAPGISRSGATIAAGRLMGVAGEDAARFGFLISIPAVLGAVVLELKDAGSGSPETFTLCLLGAGAAFVTGVLSLNLLMAVVRKKKLSWFAVYCIALGVTTLVAENI